MYLYHYFDKKTGPFKNLSDLSIDEAKAILKKIKDEKPSSLSAQRDEDYMQRRTEYENMARKLFTEKGGKVLRNTPHYMVVEACEWLNSWYEEGEYIKIPIEKFDLKTLSFTYGDMHPTFSQRVNDGKEYRKKLYMYDEILKIIDKYGLPQNWNPNGEFGPERYIEVQVWSDEIISEYSHL